MSDEVEVPMGTEFTTPTKYDPRVKARAYDLFLNSDLNATDIAIDVGVPRDVVMSWAHNGNWRAVKLSMEADMMKDAESKYRRLIAENRAPVIERHLRISAALEDAIERVILDATKDDGMPSDMKLKRLAEALSSVTGISARAAGVSDRPFLPGDEGNKQQRRPLVMVGVQVQAAPGGGTSVQVTGSEEP